MEAHIRAVNVLQFLFPKFHSSCGAAKDQSVKEQRSGFQNGYNASNKGYNLK